MRHTKRFLSFLSAICLLATVSAFAYTENSAFSETCIPLETDPAILKLNDSADLAISESVRDTNGHG